MLVAPNSVLTIGLDTKTGHGEEELIDAHRNRSHRSRPADVTTSFKLASKMCLDEPHCGRVGVLSAEMFRPLCICVLCEEEAH